MTDADTQVAVVGAGPGGYGAAFMAADLGLRVALIDPEANPGGVCLYRGCIPSKTLLHVAGLIQASRAAAEWGVVFGDVDIRVRKLRQWKSDVVRKLTGGLGQLVKQRRIRYIRSTAAFLDDHTLEIAGDGGSSRRLSFEHAVVATGSRPVEPPFGDGVGGRVMDASRALDLDGVPRTLLVVGGGYIGLEMGTIYAALGSKVTLVEMTGGLLPGVDRDLVRVLRKRLDGVFDALMLETTVAEMKAQKNGMRVVLEGPEGRSRTRIFEKVLVAVGRRPNSGGLGLENAGVRRDDRGFIRVDGQRRTAVPSIFAVGDVAGEPMLAHKATHEGRTAAEAIAGRKAFFEPEAIPAVVFTDPEIAWAGLTETGAKANGVDCDVSRFPWAASGRAATLGRGDGLTKVLAESRTGRVLGVGIVGAGAGELIAEGALAVEMGATATDLGLTVHPHPTLSETVMEAAEGICGSATSYHRPRKSGA